MKSVFEQLLSLGPDLTSLIIRDAVRLYYIDEYNKVVLELQSRYTHGYGWCTQYKAHIHAIRDNTKPRIGKDYCDVCYSRGDKPRQPLSIFRQLYIEDTHRKDNVNQYYNYDSTGHLGFDTQYVIRGLNIIYNAKLKHGLGLSFEEGIGIRTRQLSDYYPQMKRLKPNTSITFAPAYILEKKSCDIS
jgi:hypothetical protein